MNGKNFNFVPNICLFLPGLTLLWTLLLLSLKMNVPRIKLLKVGCPQDKISESRMSPKTGKHKKRATPLFRPNLRYEIEK